MSKLPRLRVKLGMEHSSFLETRAHSGQWARHKGLQL